MRDPRLSPFPAPRSDRGFVRHDLFILAAVVFLALAVVIPQALKHGLKGALIALLGVAAVLAAVVGVLFAITWLIEQVGRPGTGGRGALFRWVGHLLRFILFGFLASLIGAALVVWHGLSPAMQDLVSLAFALFGGGVGSLLYHRLGPARFWPAFGLFCLALLGSFLGGILGILGPGNWGVDIGILVPLLIFAILAASGRIVPPREGVPPPST